MWQAYTCCIHMCAHGAGNLPTPRSDTDFCSEFAWVYMYVKASGICAHAAPTQQIWTIAASVCVCVCLCASRRYVCTYNTYTEDNDFHTSFASGFV